MNELKKYEVVWYDMTREVCREHVMAHDPDEATRMAWLNHGGNPPAPCSTATEVS